MNKQQNYRPPKKRRGAELVIKHNPALCFIDDYKSLEVRTGVFFIGNAQGLRWLADYFLWAASRVDEGAPYCASDPDDHQHLSHLAPIHHQFSDRIEVITGAYSRRNRKRILKSCGIHRKSRLNGSLGEVLQHALDFQLRDAKRGASAKDLAKAIRGTKCLVAIATRAVADLEMIKSRNKREPAYGQRRQGK